MQVLADARQIADREEQIVVNMAWMRGQEADPPDSGHPLDGLQQMGQARSALRVAVRVDGLAEQGHLSHALPGEPANVFHHIVEWAAAFDPADERDDAETTDLVAAEDRRDVCGQPVLEHRPTVTSRNRSI